MQLSLLPVCVFSLLAPSSLRLLFLSKTAPSPLPIKNSERTHCVVLVPRSLVYPRGKATP